MASDLVGGLAIKSGIVAGAGAAALAGGAGLSLVGVLTTGLIVGGIIALGVGLVGAMTIYWLGEKMDGWYEAVKEFFFE